MWTVFWIQINQSASLYLGKNKKRKKYSPIYTKIFQTGKFKINAYPHVQQNSFTLRSNPQTPPHCSYGNSTRRRYWCRHSVCLNYTEILSSCGDENPGCWRWRRVLSLWTPSFSSKPTSRERILPVFVAGLTRQLWSSHVSTHLQENKYIYYTFKFILVNFEMCVYVTLKV